MHNVPTLIKPRQTHPLPRAIIMNNKEFEQRTVTLDPKSKNRASSAVRKGSLDIGYSEMLLARHPKSHATKGL